MEAAVNTTLLTPYTFVQMIEPFADEHVQVRAFVVPSLDSTSAHSRPKRLAVSLLPTVVAGLSVENRRLLSLPFEPHRAVLRLRASPVQHRALPLH